MQYLHALKDITPRDSAAEQAARKQLDGLIKPLGSLGALEDMAARLAGIKGRTDYSIARRCVAVFCADNGVVAEGVASTHPAVTLMQSRNIAGGLSGVAVLAKAFGSGVKVIDIGIDCADAGQGIIDKKIRRGTANLARGRAMAPGEVQAAIEVGFNTVTELVADGCELLGLGEMGIGNTTTSSAVLCALLGLRGDLVAPAVGTGAGLTPEAHAKKIRLITGALELHNPAEDDVTLVLSCVGGLDIAAMCGAYIGAAHSRLPVVVDGFISAVAALCAVRLQPLAGEYMLLSHRSREPGYTLAAQALGLPEPPLELGMRLGEGSGCPIMFALLDAATAILQNMGSFADAGIDTALLGSEGEKHS